MFRKKTTGEISEANAAIARTAAPGASVPRIIVMLEDVRSMHNVGSVFRSCDAFGAEALWLCGYTPTPPHRDIHKTALGATETVRWKHFSTTAEALKEAEIPGRTVIAVEQAIGSTLLHEVPAGIFSGPLVLVFGNEVTGVSDAVLKIAHQCLEIPQVGAKHSLNISVSVGVVLWEAVRKPS